MDAMNLPWGCSLGNQAGPANNGDGHKNNCGFRMAYSFKNSMCLWHVSKPLTFLVNWKISLWPSLVPACCFPQSTGSLMPLPCVFLWRFHWQSTNTNLLLGTLNMLFTPLDRAKSFRFELGFLRNKDSKLMHEHEHNCSLLNASVYEDYS